MFGRRRESSDEPPVAAYNGNGAAPPPHAALPREPAVTQPAAEAPSPAKPPPDPKLVDTLKKGALTAMRARNDAGAVGRLPRKELARQAGDIVAELLAAANLDLNPLDQRSLVTLILNDLLVQSPEMVEAPTTATSTSSNSAGAGAFANRERVAEAKIAVQPLVMERLDMAAASRLPREELSRQLRELLAEVLSELKLQMNLTEQRHVLDMLLDDMLGHGPLEPLIGDEGITDIMVNGPNQVYVERGGKLELTDVKFRDNAHVMNIASRIVSRIGRRVDESSPLCDARLEDGSRVNIIISPLAIDGASISIRKFSKRSITLERMAQQKNLSDAMANVLRIGARSRLNILISGGTGSGKTTLLNALSQMIDTGERIVTIEDAAELKLQQPHVVRLETRPPNLEGDNEITMRDLLKNSLRMRPDRIILGEIRGAEAVDMLQAMNTGHEGSMCTIHANRPREALTRLENMIGLAGINLPSRAVRTQIAAAVDMIVQVSRMRDGIRRITHIMEVVGMEGDVITTQDLFTFEYEGEDDTGKLRGTFRSTGLRPHFTPKAAYFGLDRALMETV